MRGIATDSSFLCYAVVVYVQIGLIGLVEEEWIVTLSCVDPDDVLYLDLVEEGRRLAQELKQQVIFPPISILPAA